MGLLVSMPDWARDAANAAGSWFADVTWSDFFGTWPDVTQGLLGSAVGSGLGVFGAYWVATSQMRSERKAQREAAGGQAAGAILEATLRVRELLTYFARIHPDDYDHLGLRSSVREGWQEARSAFEVAVILHGHLLPELLGQRLAAMSTRVKDALDWDFDEENRQLIEVWPSKENAPSVLEEFTAVQTDLIAYARSALGDAH